jgi:hypothetical protein
MKSRTTSEAAASPPQIKVSFPPDGESARSLPTQLLLAALVVACLAPFLGKAFHLDDSLFLWAGQHIALHPGNPYGFYVQWYNFLQPMSEVSQNPPLAAYYMAAASSCFGWSEFALHAAFLLPALVVILGTYALARRLTQRPLLAALVTLVSPGFLVSSTGVMCDTMLLAGWILAILTWLIGLEKKWPVLLMVSGLLIAICALTKYFGVTLIPLLLLYTLVRQRRLAVEALIWLVPPALVLCAYQYWTTGLYGTGLLSSAANYALSFDAMSQKGTSTGLVALLAGLSFAGGCALPALTFAPWLWSRRWILIATVAAAFAGFSMGTGLLSFPALQFIPDSHRVWFSLQLALFIAGGMSVLGLTVQDLRHRKDPESALLLVWVLGTFVFASLLNWSVNIRSLMPIIPAVGILIARRIETLPGASGKQIALKLAAPLTLALAISLWVTVADSRQANSARTAAQQIRDRIAAPEEQVSFQGHWGFQYYMQSYGFTPFDSNRSYVGGDNLLVVPHNNTNVARIRQMPEWATSQEVLALPINTGVALMDASMGAGFYSDVWGPLPFAFGRVSADEYTVYRSDSTLSSRATPTAR